MSCIKIRLKNIPNLNPSLMDSDGYFYLDLSVDAELSYNKKLTELTELDEMPFDYVLSIDVPNSPKNQAILTKYFHVGENNAITPCEVVTGMQITSIFITSTKINSKTISLNLILDDLLWAKKLSKSFVKDLASKDMFWLDSISVFEGDPQYRREGTYADNSKSQVYYPIVDYGDLYNVFKPPMVLKYTLDKDQNKNSDAGCATGIVIQDINLTDVEHVTISISNGQLVIQSLPRALAKTRLDGTVSIGGNVVFSGKADVIRINLPPNFDTLTIDLDLDKDYFLLAGWVGYKQIVGSITLVDGNSLQLVSDHKLNPVDLRPWHFMNPILKQMFCSVGFQLVCPLLDTDYGRSILTYILDDELQEDLKEFISFPLFPLGVFLHKTSITDIFQFHELGVFDITATVVGVAFDDITGESNDLEDDGIVGVYMWLFEGEIPISYLDSLILYKPEDETVIQADFSISNVAIKYGQSVRVFVQVHSGSLSIGATLDGVENPGRFKGCDASGPTVTSFKAARTAKFFWLDYDKDVVTGFQNLYLPATSIVQRDLTNLDYLKAATHLLCLKFYTDLPNKKVYALQPHEVNMYGEIVDGFYDKIGTQLELLPESYIVTPNKTDVKYHHIKFKGDDLHGNKLEVSTSDKDTETITSENPLFEPTYLQSYAPDIQSTGYGQLYRLISTNKYYFPNTVDLSAHEKQDAYLPSTQRGQVKVFSQHAVKEMEFGQSMRVLLSYGLRSQSAGFAIPVSEHMANSVTTGNNLYPTAAHYHPSITTLEGLPASATNLIAPNVRSLLFKYNQVGYDRLRPISENLVNLLHYSYIYNSYYGLTMDYLVNDFKKAFYGITLRGIYSISHLGKPYDVLIGEISDYKTCTVVSTLYKLRSITQITPPCELYDGSDPDQVVDPRTKDDCEEKNQPSVSLNYTVLNDNLNLLLSGLNTSPVSSVVFEYSTDGNTWSTAPNDTVISATISNASNYTLLYIRATVEYDDECFTTVTTPITFNTCNQIGGDRFSTDLYVKPNGDVCTKATIIIPSTIPYTVVSFTIDTGSGPVAYTNNTEVCGITQDVTYVLVTKIHDCPELTHKLIEEYVSKCVEPESLGLECAAGLTFVRTGNLPIGVLFDRVWYQTSPDNTTWGECWEEWCGDPIVCTFIRARRVVEFCGECDDICTPVIYCACNCSEVFTIDCVENCKLGIVESTTGCIVTWIGPDSFAFTGTITPKLTVDGVYTATITCGACSYVLQYSFDAVSAGTAPNPNPIFT